MKITKISQQIKKSDRYNIYIDDKFFCGISTKDLIDLDLKKGDQINSQELDNIKLYSLKGYLRDAALRYLGIRPYSERELRQKLKIKALNSKIEYERDQLEKVVEEILAELSNAGYLNDTEFAKWLVSQRMGSKNAKGIQYIKNELAKKGISNEIIGHVLENIDHSAEISQAKTLAEKKLESLKPKNLSKIKLKASISKYLAGRGYTWETIRTAVDSLLPPF